MLVINKKNKEEENTDPWEGSASEEDEEPVPFDGLETLVAQAIRTQQDEGVVETIETLLDFSRSSPVSTSKQPRIFITNNSNGSDHDDPELKEPSHRLKRVVLVPLTRYSKRKRLKER